MLPFSSFLTSIPLIVLAFAYMLFFGTNALRRIKPECKTEIILNEKQELDVTSVSTLDNALYYHNSEINTDTDYGEEIALVVYPEWIIILQRHTSEIRHFSHYYEGNTFSRPPPFLQLSLQS